MIVAVLDIAVEPLSDTCTVKVKVGVVSKSRAALLATVIWPVLPLMAKAPPVLPAVIWYDRDWPTSGSLAVTVPTTVAPALFSLTLNV